MRLATFAEGSSGPRFGIVRGDRVMDVVAAANALRRPVPATSVKAALTSGPQTLAALQSLADAAAGGAFWRPVATVKFLPPIPDPSKFFCVGKNNRKHREELKANNVRLAVIGRTHDLPAAVRKAITETQNYLAGSSGLLLNLALSYSGRAEMVEAVRAILREEPRIDPAVVDETFLANFLYTAGLPDPDLLIRTSGELRISNFMLWQLAYAELWITDTLWPDFRRRHLYQAVADYQRRERRFGRVD